jgi:hypothetical protein
MVGQLILEVQVNIGKLLAMGTQFTIWRQLTMQTQLNIGLDCDFHRCQKELDRQLAVLNI